MLVKILPMGGEEGLTLGGWDAYTGSWGDPEHRDPALPPLCPAPAAGAGSRGPVGACVLHLPSL